MEYEDLQDYGSFTAAVDAAVKRSGRDPLRTEVASMVRQIIRTNQVQAKFGQDRVEIEIEAPNNPQQWRVPNDFRIIEKARILNRFGPRGEFLYFKQAPPGSLSISRTLGGTGDRVYYRGGNIVVFAGHSPGDEIGISYMTYLQPLLDFGPVIAHRPWRYDILNQMWIDQRDAFPLLESGNPDPRASAPLESCTNWLLFDWFELVVKGAHSQILNAVDDPRGNKVFAEYRALMSALRKAETE